MWCIWWGGFRAWAEPARARLRLPVALRHAQVVQHAVGVGARARPAGGRWRCVLFVGKCRRRAKVLWFDGTGLCLLAKRLEKGRFAAVWSTPELTQSELMLFLEGSEAVGRVPLSPPPFSLEGDGRAQISQ